MGVHFREPVMTSRRSMLLGLAIAALGSLPVLADHQAVIAVPGHWQVPVIIDGRYATGAMVEGDWGLYAAGRVTPTVTGPVWITRLPPRRHYFPMTGRPPAYGRREVVPQGRRPPAPGPYYRRIWSTESEPAPATVDSSSAFGPVSGTMEPRLARRFHRSSRRSGAAGRAFSRPVSGTTP
jgi:hypothetical protein